MFGHAKPAANPVDEAGKVTPTHLVNTRDTSEHDVTTVNGHEVTVDNTGTETNSLTGEFDDRFDSRVLDLIKGFDEERQRKEDIRARHRNFNRFATLIFTLLAGLLITFGLYHGWFGPWGPALGPYSFVITVAGDTVLTAYAFIRNY